MKKKKTTAQLKKDLDKVFSQYIRLKYSKNGMCKCVTCGKVDHWKSIQNGHYISRQYLSLRYSEINCHPQCVGCNVFKGGNYTAYALFMLNTYGQETLEEMEREKQKITKDFPYESKLEYYKEQVALLDDSVL